MGSGIGRYRRRRVLITLPSYAKTYLLDLSEPNVPAYHPLVKEPRSVSPAQNIVCFTYSFLLRAIVIPHIGSATVQTRLAMAQLTVDNLIAGIKGEPMPSEAKV